LLKGRCSALDNSPKALKQVGMPLKNMMRDRQNGREQVAFVEVALGERIGFEDLDRTLQDPREPNLLAHEQAKVLDRERAQRDPAKHVRLLDNVGLELRLTPHFALEFFECSSKIGG
jgi:hypothetical protein